MNIMKIKNIIDNVENKNYLMNEIKKQDKELYDKIISLKKDESSYNEVLYKIYYEIKDPKCIVCGNPVKFDSWNKGYRKYCSAKCSNKDKNKIDKIINTKIDKYGISDNRNKPKMKRTFYSKFTKEEYQNELDKKFGIGEFKLLTFEEGSNIYLNFLHTKCNREFSKRKDIMFQNEGCPYCNKEKRQLDRRITQDKFIELCESNNNHQFEVVSQYITSDDPIELKCRKCNKIFIRGRANDVINKRYGCPYCDKSLSENELYEFICELEGSENVIKNDRTVLKPNEVDIYLPNKKIGFEYNGLFWHSEDKLGANYHINKLNLATSKNIRLIQIFEDEWLNNKEIVKSKIRHILGKNNNPKIYARKCSIKEINSYDKNKFLNENHIQGEDKSSIKLGCYYNDKLVSVMTFCSYRKSLGRTKVENEYELSRFASDKDLLVIGSFSKLLKYFIDKYNPNKIITYADRRWSDNDHNLYKKNNFKFLKNTKINYYYINNSNSYKRYHRYSYRKSELKKLFPEIYKDELSEKEIMLKAGYLRIWDCGNILYEYIL